MALSAFDDKSRQPKDADLKVAMGAAYEPWHELIRRITARFAPAEFEFRYAGKSAGWSGRIKTEKRVIVYLTPCKGYFLASFALGEKAVKAAKESDLPAGVLEVIDSARKYAEGRGVRLEVRTAEDVSSVLKIAVAKMAN